MFLTFVLSDADRIRAVTSELTQKGYAVNNAKRMVGNAVQVRVRDDTDDRTEVEQVIASLDRNANRLPDGSPSMTIRGYRDGQQR